MDFTETTKEQRAEARSTESAAELAHLTEPEDQELTDEQMAGLSGGILTELAAALRQG